MNFCIWLPKFYPDIYALLLPYHLLESDARARLGDERLRGYVRYGIRHACCRIDMTQYLFSDLIRVDKSDVNNERVSRHLHL